MIAESVLRATRVKICGLTRVSDAHFAVASGADYVGVILAGGPRLVNVSQAAELLGARRAGVQRVAVFGAQSTDVVIRIARELDLDVVQLHGDVSAGDVGRIRAETVCTVWPVLRIDGTDLPSESVALARAANWLVLDAKVVGQLGGTGVALDWSGLGASVTALRRDVPNVSIVLAGGLRPSNVAEAMRLLTPDVVDVSSGVESAPGVKDPEAVIQFVSAVRAATEIAA